MRIAACLLALGVLAGCATKPPPVAKEKIVLLPDADGRVGEVTVSTQGGVARLDRAYATAEAMSDGSVRSGEEGGAAVRERYAVLLESLPPPPISFNVFFVFDKDELTAESTAQFDRIKRELASRPSPEIVVIGHTDRVGTVEYNDALSLKRAETVRSALTEAGIRRDQIDIAGRGEREPAVATPDEVAEPRNRRVEIMVR